MSSKAERDRIKDLVVRFNSKSLASSEQKELGIFFKDLTHVVVKRHYSGYQPYYDDLEQEGVLKCYGMAPNYDHHMDPLNYFYSGIRNALHNFLYHQTKRNMDSSYEDVEFAIPNTDDVEEKADQDLLSFKMFVQSRSFIMYTDSALRLVVDANGETNEVDDHLKFLWKLFKVVAHKTGG